MGDYSFAQVPLADIPRSKFNRSHGHKTTFDAGVLVPIFVDEVLPGDTFQLSASALCRMTTPITPVMDNIYLDFFFFFVPNRLLWENWQRFCGEQDNPGDSTDYVVPTLDISGEGGAFGQSGSIFDYFGIPLGVDPQGTIDINALPFRAYNLIYNEWFRDENLKSRATFVKDDGPDPLSYYAVRHRGKRHDYFTSCLPWPQKGPGVTISLGDTAPVIPASAGAMPGFEFVGGPANVRSTLYKVANPSEELRIQGTSTVGGAADVMWNADTGLMADLTTATSATINSLRQAFQIQKLLERDARGGTRYVELLRSHFGVVSPDARLQRPEYLGGGTLPVMVNPVTQTSGTNPGGQVGGTPQGNLAAYAVAAGRGIGFSKSFVEHGYIIGIVECRADLTYQQGLSRLWSRQTRYDFYWPAFANLGEQAVLTKEIYATGDPQVDELVFGYQERWAEYRYYPSRISGGFRSNNGDGLGLDTWHLSQWFSAPPALNGGFIDDNPPMERVLAVTNYPAFLADFHFNMACTRPMPTYSVPGLIDHF